MRAQLAFIVLAGSVAASPALGDGSVFKVCGSEWRALKDAGKQGDQNWLDFLRDCRTRHAGDSAVTTQNPPPDSGPPPAVDAARPAPEAQTGKPPPVEDADKPPEITTSPSAADPAKTPEKGTGHAASGTMDAHARQKACAAEWRTLKADGKTDQWGTWPHFWHECSQRLKQAQTE